MTQRQSRRVLAALQAQQADIREKLMRQQPAEWLARVRQFGGRNAWGVDRDGRKILAKDARILGIHIHGNTGRVTVNFNRDEATRLEFNAPPALERKKKKVPVEMDVFHALRSLMHTQERHDEERNRVDAFLAGEPDKGIPGLQPFNLEIAGYRGELTETVLRDWAARTAGFRDRLAAVFDSEKQAGAFKLHEAVQEFETLAAHPERATGFTVGSIVTKLPSCVSKLTRHREERMANIDAWNRIRESVLRVERDLYVHFRLNDIYDNLATGSQTRDYREMLEADAKLVERLNACVQLVETGDRKGAQVQMTLLWAELQGKGKDFVVARLVEAIRKEQRGAKRMCITQLEEAVNFVRKNKLDYITEELEKSVEKEPYLRTALRKMRIAREHLYVNGRYDTARKWIKWAMQTLEPALMRG